MVAPYGVAVVRQNGIGVVEIGDHDDPVVYLDPGYAVVHEDGPRAVVATCPPEQTEGGENSDIRCDDVPVMGRIEDDRSSCVDKGVSAVTILVGWKHTAEVIRPFGIPHLSRNIVHWTCVSDSSRHTGVGLRKYASKANICWRISVIILYSGASSKNSAKSLGVVSAGIPRSVRVLGT